jgi:GTP:adenosylcobinamide-phosphate guanylyltransferase
MIEISSGWDGLILAAGRGPDDPLAKAFGVDNKCSLPVAGVPMLRRVVSALVDSKRFNSIAISIEDDAIVRGSLGELYARVKPVACGSSASQSVGLAFEAVPLRQPTLVTTADHALLRKDIVERFLDLSSASGADLTVGFATQEVILNSYPETHRTFLHFGHDRVSGCNLYGFNTGAALKVIEHWHNVENDRKRPWLLVRSFGLWPLIRYAMGTLSLMGACAVVSRALGLSVKPVLLPFAESAIDVDKTADLELAEKILRRG